MSIGEARTCNYTSWKKTKVERMCIAQWRASYTDHDLNDRKTLCEALAYWNYSNSPAHVQSEAVAIMQGVDCDRLLEEGIRPDTKQCCQGSAVQFKEAVAYFVIGKKSLFPKPAPYAKLAPEDLLDNVLGIRRNALFISDWADDDGNPVLPEPDQIDCGELAKALGLCGTNWKKGTLITILAFKVNQVHKSTWLDSGLVFYWCATPDLPAWGMTRSLETGRPTLREWVLPKKAGSFEIADYWDRQVEQDYDLCADKLGSDYWAACAKEIRP